MMIAVSLAGCGGGRGGRPTPEDPFASATVAPLPASSFAGTPTLLLTVGGLVVGDSVSPLTELAARRRALLEAANAALDSAFRHGARDVEWMGLEEQRRAARRAPTLRLAPERLQTAQLVGRRVEAIPEPLWSELRQLAALAGARLAVAPAAARITGGPGAYLASYLFVVVDVRLGRVVWRSRAQGAAAATPEAALQAAAGTAFPEVIR